MKLYKFNYYEICAFCWGLSFCIPDPSIPLTNIFGLTLGHFVILFLVILVLKNTNSHSFLNWALLIMPAMLPVFLLPTDDAVITLKYLITFIVFTLPVIVTANLAPQFVLNILLGVSAGILINFVFGLYQFICGITGQVYPFLFLYNYPEFNFIDANLQIMCNALRPFGLFSEPSAMAAALSPWIVLILSLGLGIIQLKGRTFLSNRILSFFKISGFLGILLIIVSQSGQALFLMAGLFFIALIFLRKYLLELKFMKLVLIVLLIIGVLISGEYFLSQRLEAPRFDPEGMGNGSWSYRYNSIMDGLDVWLNGGGMGRFLFGYGGDAFHAVWVQKGSYNICSVFFTYIINNGFVGLLAILFIFINVIRVMVRSRVFFIGMVCFLEWLLGIAFTTSYTSLISVWAALGFFLVWDKAVQRVKV